MSEQTGIVRHNPYKAAYNTHTKLAPEIQAQVDSVYTILQKKHPKTYQRIQREKAQVQADRPIINAMLDDPAIVTMLDEMTKQMHIGKQNVIANELALLGIEAGATKRDIRNAYRRKARKLHPDIGGDEEAFKQLHTAYRTALKVAHD